MQPIEVDMIGKKITQAIFKIRPQIGGRHALFKNPVRGIATALCANDNLVAQLVFL